MSSVYQNCPVRALSETLFLCPIDAFQKHYIIFPTGGEGDGGSQIKAAGPHGLWRTDISQEPSGRLLITDLHGRQRDLTICPDNPLAPLIPARVPQFSPLPQKTAVSKVNQTRHFSCENVSHAAVCESPRQAAVPEHKQWKHLFCEAFFSPQYI